MIVVSKLIANLRGVHRACGVGTTLAYAATIARTLPSLARTRTLTEADRRMARHPSRFRVQGVDVTLDGRFWGGAREMYGRGVYFPDDRYWLRPGTTVVDLGANTGLFSLLAALRGCQVLAVEAQLGFGSEIQELAQRHDVKERITVEHALVGARSGLLATPGALEGASHFLGKEPTHLSMGELFARHAVQEVDFLKCDIEGSEFDLFGDAETWLPRVRRIAMEVHCDFGAHADLERLLERHGFEVMLRDNLLRPVRALRESSGYLFALRR